MNKKKAFKATMIIIALLFSSHILPASATGSTSIPAVIVPSRKHSDERL